MAGRHLMRASEGRSRQPDAAWAKPPEIGLRGADLNCTYRKCNPAPILCDSGICDMVSIDDRDHESAVLDNRIVVQVALAAAGREPGFAAPSHRATPIGAKASEPEPSYS